MKPVIIIAVGVMFGLSMIGVSDSYAMLSLSNDGGNCSQFGTWESSSKTCKLNSDVENNFRFLSNGITLDGNGHTILGIDDRDENQSRLNCIIIDAKINITVKNLVLGKECFGVMVTDSHENLFDNISGLEQWGSITLRNSNDNKITNSLLLAIIIDLSTNNVVENNIIKNSPTYGIQLWKSSFTIIKDNEITDNASTDLHANQIRYGGIGILNGEQNSIIGNKISGNRNGITIEMGTLDVVISGNSISQNNNAGILLFANQNGVSGNTIVKQNMIENI